MLRLVSFDLDGTLIHPAIFNAVADDLGFGEPLRRSYEAYLEGTMSLEEAFEHDYRHFVGRRVDEMHAALERTSAWTPGIAEGVAQLRAAGCEVIVTTDQPRFLVEFTKRWGFDHLVCTEATVRNGRVTAEVRPEFAKWPNLERHLRSRRIPPGAVAHVGNGRNDIPVFENVGASLAVNAEDPRVATAAKRSIPRLDDVRDAVRLLLDGR